VKFVLAFVYSCLIVIQSHIFRLASSIVDYPRQEYSKDIAQFLTSDVNSTEQKSYRAGLIFLSCVFGGILSIWCFFLIWLKLNAKTVGCAAGLPFEHDTDGCQNPNAHENGGSKSYAEKKKNCRNMNDILSIESSLHSSTRSEIGATRGQEEDYPIECTNALPKASNRERRTQVAFLIFGVFVIINVSLVLILSYKPFTVTSDQYDSYLLAISYQKSKGLVK
jgi:hypothetical protein